MIFLSKIEFTNNIVLESNRASQKQFFKVRTKKRWIEDRTKPIPHISNEHPWISRRREYEKKQITESFFTIFKKGLSIDFKDVTIIVGDNGCGKTSLIQNFIPPRVVFSGRGDKDQYVKEIYDKWLVKDSRKLTFINQPSYIVVEKDIHKSSHIENFKKSKTVLSPSGILDLFDMQEFSNGENNLDFLNGLKEIKNALIVLDEPETSLSIKSQNKIVSMLRELSKHNQLMIITHSEHIMCLSDSVYDFEAKKYIETNQYIKSQQ